MAEDYYSTVKDIIKYTGVTYEKLDLSGKEALETLIEKWLKEIASIIHFNRKRNYIRDLDSGEELPIEYCEEKWSADANGVTIKLVENVDEDDDNIPKAGEQISSNEISLSSTVLDNVLLAHKEIDSDKQDLSEGKALDFYIKSSSDVHVDELEILLAGDTGCTDIKKTLSIPAFDEDEWRLFKRYLGRSSTLNDIKSIGIKHLTGLAGAEIYLSLFSILKIPEGIHNIAMRMCGNMVALAFSRRESAVIRVDDLSVKVAMDQILTSEIQKELKNYPAKANFRLMRIDTTTTKRKYND